MISVMKAVFSFLLVALLLFFSDPGCVAAAETYTYDFAGRLTRVSLKDGSYITYTYDKAGNLLQKTRKSAAVRQYTFQKGWGFFSLIFRPADTAIGEVLKSVIQNVRVVWGYDNQQKKWLKYSAVPNVIRPNTLSALEQGKGYWIYMNSPVTLNLTGVEALTSIRLYEGWDLIGYPGAEPADAGAALSDLNSKWDVVWTWRNNNWLAIPASDSGITLSSPAFTTFQPGSAYWLKIREGSGYIDWQR